MPTWETPSYFHPEIRHLIAIALEERVAGDEDRWGSQSVRAGGRIVGQRNR